MAEYDICALGELLIDFTPNGTNDQGIMLFGRNPGGAPANVLAMHAKLGGRTTFIGKVGNDDFGLFLTRTLKDAGIDTSGLAVDPEIPTTLAFVQLDARGDRSFSFYRKPGADLMLRTEDVKRDIVASSSIFHFGAVSLTGEPCRQAVHETVRFAKDSGRVISYDPNYRPLLWDNEYEAKQEMLRPIPMVDILKVSSDELLLLTGEKDLQKGAEKLAAMGPAVVMISRGAKGAFYFCKSGSGLLGAYDVKTIDTTGAGDAFFGAFLWCLRGKARKDLETIDRAEIEAATDFANAAGSLATAKKGAIPSLPDAAQIEECRKSVPRLLV